MKKKLIALSGFVMGLAPAVVFAQQTTRIGDQHTAASDAEKAVRDFGKTTSQVAIEDMQKLIDKSRETRLFA